MDKEPILIKKTPFSNIRVIGTMELKKRQLTKLLRFFFGMEPNTQEILQEVKSQDKAWKNTETAESIKETSLKVRCMVTDI